MKTFYISKKAFEQIKSANDTWAALCETSEGYNIIANYNMLAGGLDHTVVTDRQIQFHDIGCNGIDNSFQLRISKQV